MQQFVNIQITFVYCSETVLDLRVCVSSWTLGRKINFFLERVLAKVCVFFVCLKPFGFGLNRCKDNCEPNE